MNSEIGLYNLGDLVIGGCGRKNRQKAAVLKFLILNFNVSDKILIQEVFQVHTI
jgi:hypothetical protein